MPTCRKPLSSPWRWAGGEEKGCVTRTTHSPPRKTLTLNVLQHRPNTNHFTRLRTLNPPILKSTPLILETPTSHLLNLQLSRCQILQQPPCQPLTHHINKTSNYSVIMGYKTRRHFHLFCPSNKSRSVACNLAVSRVNSTQTRAGFSRL